MFFISFQAENRKQNLYPVYKNDDESDPGNYRPMSLLSIFSRMYHRLIRAYNHGQKLLTHENYQRFSLVYILLSPLVKSSLPFSLFPSNSPGSVLQHFWGRGGGGPRVGVTCVFIQIQISIVCSKALVLVQAASYQVFP